MHRYVWLLMPFKSSLPNKALCYGFIKPVLNLYFNLKNKMDISLNTCIALYDFQCLVNRVMNGAGACVGTLPCLGLSVQRIESRGRIVCMNVS